MVESIQTGIHWVDRMWNEAEVVSVPELSRLAQVDKAAHGLSAVLAVLNYDIERDCHDEERLSQALRAGLLTAADFMTGSIVEELEQLREWKAKGRPLAVAAGHKSGQA